MGKESKKLITNNKKVRSGYLILKIFETGIEFFGVEVKTSRIGYYSVKEGWVDTWSGEIFIYEMHINPYEKGSTFNKGPLRVQKLSMHKSEIRRLTGTIKEKGLTLVPLGVYLKGRPVKMEIGLAQSKKKYNKRATIAKNDARRGLERSFKRSVRYQNDSQ